MVGPEPCFTRLQPSHDLLLREGVIYTQPLTLLIVEDDEVDRLAMRRNLAGSDIGFAMQEATNLSRAREVLAGGELDCVLLDLDLPDGDGFTLLDEARLDPESWPPIIVLTGLDDTPTGIEAMRRGAEDYLVKGQVDGEHLVRAIRYAIERHHLRRALADRVRELERLMERVQTLEGLLPMCSYCRKIRDTENYWLSVEDYLEQCSDATFSHGICPSCYEERVVPELEQAEATTRRRRRAARELTPLDMPPAATCRRHPTPPPDED